MRRDSKKRLFEVMKKTNPDFKELNEQGYQQPNANTGAQQYTGDIKSIQNTTTSSQLTAYSRVDTPNEFTQAFKIWFASLGFDPQKNPIAIGRVTADVTNILRELGYR